MSYEIFRFAKAINKLNDNLIELKKINININYTIFFPLKYQNCYYKINI